MKIQADQYGSVITLLHLPRSADVWQPWNQRGQRHRLAFSQRNNVSGHKAR